MFKKYRLIQVPAQNVNTANDKPIFYLQLNHAKNISVQNQIRGHNIRQKSYNPTASTGFDTEKQVEKTPNKVNVNNINHGSTIPHESGRTASNHESLKKGSRTSSPWPPPPSPPSHGSGAVGARRPCCPGSRRGTRSASPPAPAAASCDRVDRTRSC